jgi:hypothetical protein
MGDRKIKTMNHHHQHVGMHFRSKIDIATHIITLVVVWMISVICCSATTCTTDTVEALLEFRSAFSDPSGKVFSTWDSGGSDCCSWKGVTCQDSALITLDVEGPSGTGSDQVTKNQSYSGGKPGNTLYKLKDLQTLKLTHLQFSTKIPSQWSSFSNNVVSITVNDCDLQGSIPSGLANIDHLQRLDLSNNNLSGSIPSKLCNLKSLTYLDLSYNQLDTSSVPDCLANGGSITNVNYGHQSSSSSSSSSSSGSGSGSGSGGGSSSSGSGSSYSSGNLQLNPPASSPSLLFASLLLSSVILLSNLMML